MALLTVIHYPDPRLRKKASPIDVVDKEIQSLVDDMFDTMYAAPGIGLAAVQVDVPKQLIVIDISETKDEPYCFINPQILEKRGEQMVEEGCLSVPGIYEDVKRYDWIKVRALDKNGKEFELETDGILAICIQHEMDHLQGKLFVDYLSELKRTRIRKKLEKNQRMTM